MSSINLFMVVMIDYLLSSNGISSLVPALLWSRLMCILRLFTKFVNCLSLMDFETLWYSIVNWWRTFNNCKWQVLIVLIVTVKGADPSVIVYFRCPNSRSDRGSRF